MPVPTYDQFIEPILRFLAQHPQGASARDAHEAAATALSLSDVDRSERLPSGMQAVYKNRAGWAHDRLKRAGLSQSPRRGYWCLTQEGIEYARSHPFPLSKELLEKLAIGYKDVRLRSGEKTLEGESSLNQFSIAEASIAAVDEVSTSPDDRLEQALAEIQDSVAAELLEIISISSPDFFEVLVLDLLHAMGYGTNREALKRVGGVGDGGIDGIISLDRLGLEKVYVQAKRWQSSVGRPEIQSFYGALAGQRASKGVFITTSNYTAQALDFAKSVERIVLVNGTQLARHMIEYGVGVSHRTVKVPKIDSDYFEN